MTVKSISVVADTTTATNTMRYRASVAVVDSAGKVMANANVRGKFTQSNGMSEVDSANTSMFGIASVLTTATWPVGTPVDHSTTFCLENVHFCPWCSYLCSCINAAI